jgi:hypothetical protein
MSRQKAKGTAFETACVRYLRERLGDDRIERRALHGNGDMGDLFGLYAHGHEGIVECKDYASWSKADLRRWQEQTVNERGNADADFALLIVHKKGCGAGRFGENHCYMQIRDLERVMGGDFRCLAGDTAKGMWVRVTADDACRMMLGYYEEE